MQLGWATSSHNISYGPSHTENKQQIQTYSHDNSNMNGKYQFKW